jgi:hypothetical protein
MAHGAPCTKHLKLHFLLGLSLPQFSSFLTILHSSVDSSPFPFDSFSLSLLSFASSSEFYCFYFSLEGHSGICYMVLGLALLDLIDFVCVIWFWFMY